ncbi:Chitinase 2 [Coemansia sp. Benny D115]|nr:Chitinase 2 [Coemansia sp. Benny D115]
MQLSATLLSLLLHQVLATLATAAFNVNCNSNYVSYYGQNSARNQKRLGEYCKDSTEDVIVLAFMNGFPNILLNFANACETTFDSGLLHCPNIANDIKYCQSQGKVVVLSMGGASGAYGFSSDSQASRFADTVWNMFFKGSANERPFDDAVLDGIDLDIEGGSPEGYKAFIDTLRGHYASDPSRQYYIAAAPQCPFPDAYLGNVLNSAWFDMVYVQFYNNYCGLNAYPSWFNFADWDNWAKTSSINKNVKVYIGAPGSPSAASSGYVSGSTLRNIYNDVRSQYSSLGGIMTWDVSQSRSSGLARDIRTMLDDGGSCGNSTHQYPTDDTSTSFSSSDTLESTNTDSQTDTDADTDTSTSIRVTTTRTITSKRTRTTTISRKPRTSRTTSTKVNTLTLLPSDSQATDTLLTPPAPTSGTNTTQPELKCPVEGANCREEYTQACTRNGFALCLYGKWAIYQCSTGTACYLRGNTAFCDWEDAHPRDPCSGQPNPKQLDSRLSLLTNWDANDDIKPITAFISKGIKSKWEFVPLESRFGRFKALLKVQSLVEPIPQAWRLELVLPKGQFVDKVSRGSISMDGSIATIYTSEHEEDVGSNMAIEIKVSGGYFGSYNVPDLSMAQIEPAK